MSCNLDMAKFILEFGAKTINLDLPVYGGNTALNYAIISDFDIEFIALLIKSGVNVNLASNHSGLRSFSPMFHAISKNRKDVVVLILNNGYLDSDEAFYSAITASVRDIEILKLLIPVSKLASINAALYSAINTNVEDTEIIKLLLDSGTDVNYHNPSNWSLLGWACIRAKLDTARLLISYGADINYQGRGQDGMVTNTPLNSCCSSKNTDLLKLLLSQPNINTEQLIYDHQSKIHRTVYEFANIRGLHEVVKIFDEYYINKLKQ
jgi:ankyrin repeat protein